MIKKSNLVPRYAMSDWLFTILTPTASVTIVAIGFIWAHLQKIGRLDVLFEAVSVKDMISFVAFSSLLSVVAFSLVFYAPSIMAAVIIRRINNNHEDYGKIKEIYIKTLLLCSLISIIIICLSMFFKPELLNTKVGVVFLVICSCLLCIISLLLFGFKYSDQWAYGKTNWGKFKIYASVHLLTPGLLGFVSWMFIYPFSILIRTINFPEGTSDVIELLIIAGFGCTIVILSLLPAFVFLRLQPDEGYFKQGVIVGGVSIMLLIVCSFIMPVIPSLIVNMSMKLVGVIDLKPTKIVIVSEKYPADIFLAPEWHLSHTKDKGKSVVESISLFSLGRVSLLCPTNVLTSYRAELNFTPSILIDKQKDVDDISSTSSKCIIFDKGDYIKFV